MDSMWRRSIGFWFYRPFCTFTGSVSTLIGHSGARGIAGVGSARGSVDGSDDAETALRIDGYSLDEDELGAFGYGAGLYRREAISSARLRPLALM